MVIKKIKTFHLEEKGELAESCGWLFIDFIPLIYEKGRVARQLQVETWLELSKLVKELEIEKLDKTKQDTRLTLSYVV